MPKQNKNDRRLELKRKSLHHDLTPDEQEELARLELEKEIEDALHPKNSN